MKDNLSKKMLMLATTAAMIEQFNKNNILILEDMGYEVHVAGNWEQGNPISDERLEEFKKWLKDHHGVWFQIPASRNPMNLIDNGRAYKIVTELIHKNQYRFIHCHTPVGSVIGRIAAHYTHTKIIYTAHGFHFFTGAPWKNWVLYYPVERFLSRWTDVLVTINEEDYQRAKNSFHMKKLEKIPGVGVELDRFGTLSMDREEKRKELGIDEDTVVLFSAGELIARKNHGAVIHSLALLKEKIDKKVKYFIAGKGDLEDSYKNLIQELHLENEVQLLGFRNDISELCEASDIYILPSLQEGLSLALMEAMASSMPCVVSDIRGNRDLIQDKKGGYLVSVDDIKQWAVALEKLITDKALQIKMGAYNREVIEKHSAEKICEMIRTNIYGGGGKTFTADMASKKSRGIES